MDAGVKCCVLCGLPVEHLERWPKWMRSFRAIFTVAPEINPALSGPGFRHGDFDVIKSPQSTRDNPRWPDIILLRSAFEQYGPDQPPDSTWGFPFHWFCWDMFIIQYTPNVTKLFDFLRSFPVQRVGVMNFGHNYGGLYEYVPGPKKLAPGDEPLLDLQKSENDLRDAFDIPDLLNVFRRASVPSAPLKATVVATISQASADVFSQLPHEILQAILNLLPSKDVLHLKVASRVYAHVPLPDLFWKTRFLPGREFDYVLEAKRHMASRDGEWKSFYASVKRLHRLPAVANRRRVWRLAKSMQDLLDRIGDAPCEGDAICSFWEPDAPSDKANWTTAIRSLKPPQSEFVEGCRSLYERSLVVPSETTTLSLSTIEVHGRVYICGIHFRHGDDDQCNIGYNHSQNQVILVKDKSQFITGFHLAQDQRGIRGMSIISSAGTSSWIGDHRGIPKRRLTISSTSEVPITSIKGGFDAMKLVFLSISGGDEAPAKTALSLRDTAVWFPDIPDQGLSFLGPAQPTTESGQWLPCSMTLFGGLDGQNLHQVHFIQVHLGIVRNVVAIDVFFTHGRLPLRLGTQHCPAVNSHGFQFNSAGGERIIGLGTIHSGDQDKFIGFRIITNRGRMAEFPPQLPPSYTIGLANNPEEANTIQVFYPGTGAIIGFYATVHGTSGLDNVGIVVRNHGADEGNSDVKSS